MRLIDLISLSFGMTVSYWFNICSAALKLRSFICPYIMPLRAVVSLSSFSLAEAFVSDTLNPPVPRRRFIEKCFG